jgi:cytochrome c
MPYTVPGSLSTDDTYAVTAYLFSINGIVPADATLDERSLPAVKMPNRNGFLPDRVFELYDEKP